MARVPLSDTGEWQLKHGDQDVRGYDAVDATGNRVSTVDEMIVNTDERRVDAIVLEDGTEVPARDIRIGDGAVYLSAEAASAAGGTVTVYDGGEVVERQRVATADYDAYADDFRAHHGETYGGTGRDYSSYEPAYRYGYETAHEGAYRDRPYREAEGDLRRGYSSRYPESRYEDVRDAVRYGYTRARRSRR